MRPPPTAPILLRSCQRRASARTSADASSSSSLARCASSVCYAAPLPSARRFARGAGISFLFWRVVPHAGNPSYFAAQSMRLQMQVVCSRMMGRQAHTTPTAHELIGGTGTCASSVWRTVTRRTAACGSCFRRGSSTVRLSTPDASAAAAPPASSSGSAGSTSAAHRLPLSYMCCRSPSTALRAPNNLKSRSSVKQAQ